jgi:NAD-dependent SIR2 family protein deacetylase
MPTCRGCGETVDADELERHERDGLVRVHCPDCGFAMGTWRDPAAGPVRDRRG